MEQAQATQPAVAPAQAETPATQGQEQQTPEQAEYQKLYEMKVNGQVRKYSIQELMNKASLADASHERFQKASEMTKKAEAYKQKMKENFIEGLMDPELGLSKEQIRDKFEHWYKENFIDPEMMSPEQRKLKEYEAKEREWNKHQEDAEKQKAEAEYIQLERVANAQIQKDIIDGLEKNGLPKNRYTVSRYAYWAKQNLQRGFDAPPDVIWQQVKDEQESMYGNIMTESAIDRLLTSENGKKIIDMVRKYDMDQLTKSRNIQPERQQKVSTSSPKTGKTMRDVDKYFNELRRSKR